MLANPSRGCPWAISFLRTLRGVVGTFILVREAFARLPERFFSFASPSRASQRTFWPLRTLREVARAIFHARETFASLPEPSVTLAKPSPASPAEAASLCGSTSCSYSRWINYCITHSPVPMATSRGISDGSENRPLIQTSTHKVAGRAVRRGFNRSISCQQNRGRHGHTLRWTDLGHYGNINCHFRKTTRGIYSYCHPRQAKTSSRTNQSSMVNRQLW